LFPSHDHGPVVIVGCADISEISHHFNCIYTELPVSVPAGVSYLYSKVAHVGKPLASNMYHRIRRSIVDLIFALRVQRDPEMCDLPYAFNTSMFRGEITSRFNIRLHGIEKVSYSQETVHDYLQVAYSACRVVSIADRGDVVSQLDGVEQCLLTDGVMVYYMPRQMHKSGSSILRHMMGPYIRHDRMTHMCICLGMALCYGNQRQRLFEAMRCEYYELFDSSDFVHLPSRIELEFFRLYFPSVFDFFMTTDLFDIHNHFLKEVYFPRFMIVKSKWIGADRFSLCASLDAFLFRLGCDSTGELVYSQAQTLNLLVTSIPRPRS